MIGVSLNIQVRTFTESTHWKRIHWEEYSIFANKLKWHFLSVNIIRLNCLFFTRNHRILLTALLVKTYAVVI